MTVALGGGRWGRGTARAAVAAGVVAALVLVGRGAGAATTRYEVETAGTVTGSCWGVVATSNFSGGNGRSCVSDNVSAYSLTFTAVDGDVAQLYGYQDGQDRSFQVLVDGGAFTVVPNTGGGGWNTLLWSSGALAAGSHTVSFRLNGSGFTTLLDYVDVVGAAVTTTRAPTASTTVPATTTTTVPATTTTTVPATTTTTVPATTTTSEPVRVVLGGEQAGVFWLLAAGVSAALGVMFHKFLWGREYR